MRYLVTSSWFGIGLIALTATISAEAVLEKTAEEVAQQRESNELKAEKAEALTQVELDAEIAMARITGHCTIIFNADTGAPAMNFQERYQLINSDGAFLSAGSPVCAKNGVTALVARIGGHLGPADIRKVPITQLAEYQKFYSMYPEVKTYERKHGKL